jgi:GTPase SAR1 family protein
VQKNGILLFLLKRVTELLEKAPPGVVIALVGNKSDLEDKQISKEVK